MSQIEPSPFCNTRQPELDSDLVELMQFETPDQELSSSYESALKNVIDVAEDFMEKIRNHQKSDVDQDMEIPGETESKRQIIPAFFKSRNFISDTQKKQNKAFLKDLKLSSERRLNQKSNATPILDTRDYGKAKNFGILKYDGESLDYQFEELELKALTHSDGSPKQFIKKRPPKEIQIDQANHLLTKVEHSAAIRQDASDATEGFMDDVYKNSFNWDKLVTYIDQVVANSSSTAMAALANIKASDQTYGHCIDVATIFCSVYMKLVSEGSIENIFKNKNHVMLSAFLHDFGKSQIPAYILNSTEIFDKDSVEVKVLQSHATLGAKLMMEQMDVPDHFINMALYHHVKKNKNRYNSYPAVDDDVEILYETQLLAIVDIYQALIGSRSYKKVWSPAATMQYLSILAGIEFDLNVFEDFRRVMGKYPIGSLVRLTDGSIGFVINVPPNDFSNPGVILIKDAEGNELKKHAYIDLNDETELNIDQDLDHEKHLGDKGVSLFAQIRAC